MVNEEKSKIMIPHEILIAVYLRPYLSTIHTYWPLAQLVDMPLLRRVLRRLIDNCGSLGFRIGVLGHHGVWENKVREAAHGLDVSVLLWGEYLTQREVLAAAAESNSTLRHFALFPETVVFPDCVTTVAMLQHHIESKADATVCKETPRGLLPVVYSSASISRLNSLSLPPEVADDPAIIMGRMATIYPDLPECQFNISSFSPGRDLLRRLGELPQRVLVDTGAALAAAEAVILDCHAPAQADYQEAIRMRKELQYRRVFPVPRTPTRQDSRHTILFATKFAGYSGAEESLCQLACNLSTRYYRPIAVVPLEGVLAKRLRRGGVQVQVTFNDLDLIHPDSLAFFTGLLSENRVEIVHVNVSAGLPLLMAAYYGRVPIITHVRTLFGNTAPEWMRLSSALISVSERVTLDLLRSGFPVERIETIYNGVDLNMFGAIAEGSASIDVRQELGIGPQQVVLLQVARICRQKRQDLLIQALPSLKSYFPDIVVCFLGELDPSESHYMARLQQAIKTQGVTDNVRFLGFHDDVRRFYAIADAMVLCTEVEPFGRCVLEALAMGVPVVVSKEGGHSEILRPDESCVMFEANDSFSLAKAIHRLLVDRALGRRLAKQGQAIVQDLRIESHVGRITALYERILRAKM